MSDQNLFLVVRPVQNGSSFSAAQITALGETLETGKAHVISLDNFRFVPYLIWNQEDSNTIQSAYDFHIFGSCALVLSRRHFSLDPPSSQQVHCLPSCCWNADITKFYIGLVQNQIGPFLEHLIWLALERDWVAFEPAHHTKTVARSPNDFHSLFLNSTAFLLRFSIIFHLSFTLPCSGLFSPCLGTRAHYLGSLGKTKRYTRGTVRTVRASWDQSWPVHYNETPTSQTARQWQKLNVLRPCRGQGPGATATGPGHYQRNEHQRTAVKIKSQTPQFSFHPVLTCFKDHMHRRLLKHCSRFQRIPIHPCLPASICMLTYPNISTKGTLATNFANKLPYPIQCHVVHP